jgi:protein-S-isoprenylcysteine O-methyltransferase Ste14
VRPEFFDILILAGMWMTYFVIHSLLASLRMKRWMAGKWPALMPLYRLVFNGLALLLLIPPLWFTFSLPGTAIWVWGGPWFWLANGMALLACAAFFWSLRYYDGSEFLGLRQWRSSMHSVEDQERLHISPLHRFVRHPWYSLGLVLIWTRDMDPALLVSSVVITLYFVVGSRLEERKLMVFHGDLYRHYARQVPSLVPLPWRYLSREEAQRLSSAAGEP